MWLAANGTTPRELTRKELKKLRQKTKKILIKLQDNENNETHEDESNLNESGKNSIDPNQNSLNINGSDDDRDTASGNDIHFVNSSGIWVRPAGWVPPESSSADSSAVKPGDPSEVNIPLTPLPRTSTTSALKA